MKKRILCVILSLVAVFGLVGFNATEAWFSSGENNSMRLSSGGLDFVASGGLALAEDEKDLILPGAELTLKEAILITNTSTIDSELRVRVECTYVDDEGVKSQPFIWIEFANAGDSNWEVGEDGFLYYTPKVVAGDDRRIPATETQETEITTVAETTAEAETEAGETTTDGVAAIDFENPADNEIPLAGTIIISGDVPIDLQNKEMTIKFILEAKQADFFTWEQFDSVQNNE